MIHCLHLKDFKEKSIIAFIAELGRIHVLTVYFISNQCIGFAPREMRFFIIYEC